MNSKYKNKTSWVGVVILALTFFFCGCKKLVDVAPPVTSVTSASVYTSDATAIAVLTNLYSQLSANQFNGINISTTSLWTGLSADEFTLWSGANVSQNAFYKNGLQMLIAGSEFWNNIYPYIYTCNAAIEGLNNSNSLTPSVKQQLLGEAKFSRAFFYFYLVNLYGDVPLVLTTDYTVNVSLPSASKAQVYERIIADLKEARGLLIDGYIKSDGITVYTPGSEERVRPNKSAATALLARTYLYSGDYVNAEAQATIVINNSSMYSLSTLNNTFLKASPVNKEPIWQLQSVQGASFSNTAEGGLFVLSFAPAGINNTHFVFLSPSLLNSFEPGDQRKTTGNWVNVYTDATGTYYYPYKYKVTSTATVTATEYRMVLRLGEQYLIRAEARAQQNNFPGAQADLNTIRTRAGLPNTSANDKPSLLIAVLHERQVELFTEGHRWLDLKRSGTVDDVMNIATPLKGGGSWNTTQQLYPLPSGDLLKDLNLVQNPGY